MNMVLLRDEISSLGNFGSGNSESSSPEISKKSDSIEAPASVFRK